MNKIYLIERPGVTVYDDCYNSIVVVAEDEHQARRMHPQSGFVYDEEQMKFVNKFGMVPRTPDCWTKNINSLRVLELGVAHDTIKPGVVHTSFYESW